MVKHKLRRWAPNAERIKQEKSLRWLAHFFADGNLWHMNRRSVAGAFAVGLFFAFIPMPFQMLAAAIFAIIFRVNLPISVALVWISNPLTMPPIFYGCYRLGAWMLNEPALAYHFEISWQWLTETMSQIGPAFLLGCVTVATLASLAGYFGMLSLWRYSAWNNWKKRRARVRNKG